MEKLQSETALEQKYLEDTIALANAQMEAAIRANEEAKEKITEAKRELRENNSHAFANLYSSEAFEALGELSQELSPLMMSMSDYEAVEEKIKQLKRLIESPYFARINFRFEDEEEYEPVYIGRTSLKKDKFGGMRVYDWRSPIASVFYRFMTGKVFYDAPAGRIQGEINLKRQYEIKNSKLEYFFDADLEIMDEILRKMLSQNTTPKMKTIVETIQREQDIIIRDLENDLMMVQGVAGSGKTSIALHRAAYLMYQGLAGKLKAANIMIVSPNRVFEQYIADVLPELGEENVVTKIFEDFVKKELRYEGIQSRNRFLEALYTEKYHRDTKKKSLEWKMSDSFMKLVEKLILEIPDRYLEFEDICYKGNCVISKEVLRERVLSRAEVPLGMKLRQLESFVIEEFRMPGRVKLSSEEWEELLTFVRQMTRLDAQQLYRDLFSDKVYFDHLAQGLLEEKERDDIFKYTQENLYGTVLWYDDATAVTYLHLKLFGSSKYANIKQVVIDEAQDYYPLQYHIFGMLFPNARFTVLGDVNQTLEKQEKLEFYDKIRRILHKKRAMLITLDKSFRCTSEILDFGLQFIDRKPEMQCFNRNGEAPHVIRACSWQEMENAILQEIEQCKAQGLKSIGLLCKTEKNARQIYDRLKDRTEVSLITQNSDFELRGVCLMPLYLAKGLEFDGVLVCDANRHFYPGKEDKNLLYVACTRALHRLNLFCMGEEIL
ncbi:MAG: AAA family ATPase [Lachnospiraceae bacterium]|nr:AAA family ATPase [Lachnospiraceae bacterium]